MMDRSSVTYTLQPLEKKGFIKFVPGVDRRSRVITLTAKGRRALVKALPYWQQAQQGIARSVGERRFNYLLVNIARYRTLSGN